MVSAALIAIHHRGTEDSELFTEKTHAVVMIIQIRKAQIEDIPALEELDPRLCQRAKLAILYYQANQERAGPRFRAGHPVDT